MGRSAATRTRALRAMRKERLCPPCAESRGPDRTKTWRTARTRAALPCPRRTRKRRTRCPPRVPVQTVRVVIIDRKRRKERRRQHDVVVRRVDRGVQRLLGRPRRTPGEQHRDRRQSKPDHGDPPHASSFRHRQYTMRTNVPTPCLTHNPRSCSAPLPPAGDVGPRRRPGEFARIARERRLRKRETGPPVQVFRLRGKGRRSRPGV